MEYILLQVVPVDTNNIRQLLCSFKAEGYVAFAVNNNTCVAQRQFRVSEKLVCVWSEKTAELQSRLVLHRSKKKLKKIWYSKSQLELRTPATTVMKYQTHIIYLPGS